jgi:uncharacterized protein YjiS (DUF1127 family)
MRQWILRAVERFKEYQKKRADYLLLRSMSDKELHDIGLARGSIRSVVYGD